MEASMKSLRSSNRQVLLTLSFVFLSAVIFVFTATTRSAHMQGGAEASSTAVESVGQYVAGPGGNDAAAKARAAEATKSDASQPAAMSPNAPQVAGNYTFTTATNASLTDMSVGTTQLLGANIDDTASPLTNIGFDFYFQGVRFTQFGINDNGVVRLGATAQTSTPYQPLAQAGLSIITAYGGDQRTHTGDGKVHFKVTGVAPNRVLNIEWLNMQSNFNTGGTADLTYQVRLYETTGVIEHVYGSMTMSTLGAADTNSNDPQIGFSSSNTAGTVGSVTAAQSGAPPPSFDGASATPTNNLYTAGAITVLTSAAQGSRRIFTYTPPTPTAPTGLNFTGVTQLAMTLNWTDSPNETLYAVYRSTDGINFTFDGTAVQNATSYNATGLNPGTNYFWNVYAVSEGALSTALSGSQATTPAGNISSTAAGGNWSAPATWVGGVVPGPGDNATIVTGATVTIDSSNCLNLTVQTGATLQFELTTARTLTVGQSATIDAGGVFQSNPLGTQLGHVVSIGGNLTNNGTIDFSTNGNTAGASITFTGATDATATFGGASTTDLQDSAPAGITLNKGTNNTPVLSFNPGGTITVLGANTAGFLTITNGTFKMDGAGAFSNPLFNVAAYNIPATGGIWMNNANATVVGQNGSPSSSGLFRMTAGTFNIGNSSGNSIGFGAGSNINIEGGAINAAGRFGISASSNAITYNQTAGTITVCTVGNASTTLGSFDLGTGVGTTNISGGTIIVQLASTAVSGPRDYRNQSGLTGTTTVTGGTVQFGNAASGAAKAFSAAGVFPNLVIDNTSANHSVTLLAPAVFNNITRNITINTGTTFNIGNNVFLMNGTTLTNNGTMTANGASSNFVWFLTTAPQTYQGTGVVTAPVTNFAIQADQGLILNPAVNNIVVSAIRLFSGSVTNSNKITLGNGGATTGIVQIGNTTTPTACGTFDVAFTFNLGTGGQTMSYLRCTASRSTGPEINPTRSLTTMTYDENNAAQNLTLAGGDLTVVGTTALTNGRLITGANTQIVGSAGVVTRTTGYVDGNFRKTYTAAGSKSFEVGTANGFSPVTVNATAGTFPSDFTVKAVQGPQPNVNAATSIQRYWTLTEAGDITADLTFNYLDPPDVMGNEAAYKVIRVSGGTPVAFPTSVVTPAANTATLTGVFNFSDWTVGEIVAPTAGSSRISGVVTDTEGRPIGGVSVRLSGNSGARTITDRNGNYRFSGLDTSGFYTVTPDLTDYSFSPSSRSFSLVADRTDAVFTGTRSSDPRGNPVTRADFFVRQQYLDFLGREPDMQGWLFWTDQLNACGIDANCVREKRIDISAAFFMSDEFQQGGNFVYRLYRAGLGRRLTYDEFNTDRQQVIGGPALENSRRAFAESFVGRAEFMQKYDGMESGATFVDALLQSARLDAGVELGAQRDALLAAYNAGSDRNHSRSAVLQAVAEAGEYQRAVYNSSFVLTEYFGYLQRGPDGNGYAFWLEVLNERDRGNYRGMVCSFLTSAEYQRRFSTNVLNSNAECGQ
jgi:hypothetical protein